MFWGPDRKNNFMDFAISDWPVLPMEPVTTNEAFDDADTLFQVKWDGVRILAYKYPDGQLRLFNRRKNERTQQYPEILQALMALPGGTLLDGEIVALNEAGKPDFPRVLRRDLLRSIAKIQLQAAHIPVHYMVFDVLWHDGTACYALPLAQRLKILDKITFTSHMIHTVDAIPSQGRALFEAVKAEGLEGIVAKKAQSAYFIGKKTPLWQKIKCLRTVNAVVGGFIREEPVRIRSLLMGLSMEGGLQYIGAAASGVTQRQWLDITALLDKIPGPCPFENPPAVKNAYWVQPVLHAEVRFLEYTADGTMRAPAILNFLGGV
jgi:bifunctional non-homologous end joining protein LigD